MGLLDDTLPAVDETIVVVEGSELSVLSLALLLLMACIAWTRVSINCVIACWLLVGSVVADVLLVVDVVAVVATALLTFTPADDNAPTTSLYKPFVRADSLRLPSDSTVGNTLPLLLSVLFNHHSGLVVVSLTEILIMNLLR